jgi:hypothetical protein
MTTEACTAFRESLALTRQKIPTADRLLQQLLLAHTVTLLEVYLQKLVESLIAHNDKLLLKLAETTHVPKDIHFVFDFSEPKSYAWPHPLHEELSHDPPPFFPDFPVGYTLVSRGVPLCSACLFVWP